MPALYERRAAPLHSRCSTRNAPQLPTHSPIVQAAAMPAPCAAFPYTMMHPPAVPAAPGQHQHAFSVAQPSMMGREQAPAHPVAPALAGGYPCPLSSPPTSVAALHPVKVLGFEGANPIVTISGDAELCEMEGPHATDGATDGAEPAVRSRLAWEPSGELRLRVGDSPIRYVPIGQGAKMAAAPQASASSGAAPTVPIARDTLIYDSPMREPVDAEDVAPQPREQPAPPPPSVESDETSPCDSPSPSDGAPPSAPPRAPATWPIHCRP